MRVRATCDDCGREFLFFQLYNTHPDAADRCPHYGRHLGVVNVRPLALQVERAAARLTAGLNELAARNPAFRVEPDTVLGPVTDAVAALSASTEGPAPPRKSSTRTSVLAVALAQAPPGGGARGGPPWLTLLRSVSTTATVKPEPWPP